MKKIDINLLDKMLFLGTLLAYKLQIGTQTDAAHSNGYIHFNSCQHSKISPEQKVSKFCMYFFNHLTVCPSVDYEILKAHTVAQQ